MGTVRLKSDKKITQETEKRRVNRGKSLSGLTVALATEASTASPDALKQTFDLRRWGRVGETGGPAHSDGIAICRSSND